MDILKLGEILNLQGRQRVEDLIFEALRKQLDGYNQTIDELEFQLVQEEFGQLGRDYVLYSLESAKEDRRHFLQLLGALTGVGYNFDGDPLATWSVFDQVRAERREIHELFSADTEMMLALPPPTVKISQDLAGGRRRGAPQTKRPQVLAGMRRSIENQRYTIDQLKSGEVTLDALAAEFDCSRTLVKAALAAL